MKRRPSSSVENDLCNLVGERVRRAVMSVMQLADDDKQAFVIACTAEATVAGILAGAFCQMTGRPTASVDPTEVAITVLQTAKETAAAEAGR